MTQYEALSLQIQLHTLIGVARLLIPLMDDEPDDDEDDDSDATPAGQLTAAENIEVSKLELGDWQRTTRRLLDQAILLVKNLPRPPAKG